MTEWSNQEILNWMCDELARREISPASADELISMGGTVEVEYKSAVFYYNRDQEGELCAGLNNFKGGPYSVYDSIRGAAEEPDYVCSRIEKLPPLKTSTCPYEEDTTPRIEVGSSTRTDFVYGDSNCRAFVNHGFEALHKYNRQEQTFETYKIGDWVTIEEAQFLIEAGCEVNYALHTKDHEQAYFLDDGELQVKFGSDKPERSVFDSLDEFSCSTHTGFKLVSFPLVDEPGPGTINDNNTGISDDTNVILGNGRLERFRRSHS